MLGLYKESEGRKLVIVWASILASAFVAPSLSPSACVERVKLGAGVIRGGAVAACRCFFEVYPLMFTSTHKRDFS